MDLMLTLSCLSMCLAVSTTLFVDPLLDLNEAIGEYRKREAVSLTNADKEAILKLHNDYRAVANPPAANMRLQTWDYEAERTAQLWANNCAFKHGMPESAKKSMGQNLYIGPDKKGLRATMLWWNETDDYYFWDNSCVENAQCGHYTQLMWATSERLGCAIQSCPEGNLFVCHYEPPGNIKGSQPYEVGKPCSQCNTNSGGRCFDSLCVTDEECERMEPNKCSCPMTCHNCGILDKEKCRCACKDGWDSIDCSKKCDDSDELCHANPGYPPSYCYNIHVRLRLCRAMCQQCNSTPAEFPKLFFDPDITGESGRTLSNICYNGVTCPRGYILDEDFGECKLLCPGPKCGSLRIHAISFSLIVSLIALSFLLRE